MPSTFRSLCLASTLVLPLALFGCGDKGGKDQAAAAAPPPAEVAVVTIEPHRIAVVNELPGRLVANRVAQVRARVSGIVQKRVFKEGSDVKAGDVLFRIDPAPYQAAFNSAEASLAKAQANLAQANTRLKRYQPLVESGAISKQEYDDVVNAQKQAKADVATAEAAKKTAQLNLGYATVTAPISGRIGRALVTEGALVGQGEPTPLALIQQLDPILVSVTQTTGELIQLQRALAAGKLQQVGEDEARVQLVAEDGQVYPHSGKLLFSDLSVDESSGTVTLRAEFPNPDRFLLPGMYVRARLEQAVRENAIAVPQQAVVRGQEGATVMVVGAENKVEVRPVTTAEEQNGRWIITDGLKAGDRVIVEGLQKIGPGAPVRPVAWKDPMGTPAVADQGAQQAAPQSTAPAASQEQAQPAPDAGPAPASGKQTQKQESAKPAAPPAAGEGATAEPDTATNASQ